MGTKFIQHPKHTKRCVFCNFWMGDAEMEYVSVQQGYRYDGTKKGKCLKHGGSLRDSCTSCDKYEPSMEAKRLL